MLAATSRRRVGCVGRSTAAGAVWRRICEALTLLTGTLQIVPGTSQATLPYPPSGRRARTGPLPGGRAPGAEGHGRGRVYLRGGQQVRAHADMRLVALREAPGTYTTEHRLQPGSCNQDRLGAIFKDFRDALMQTQRAAPRPGGARYPAAPIAWPPRKAHRPGSRGWRPTRTP